MAFSDIATVGFAVRNIDKTSSGDLGRLPVALGQCANALKAGAELNNEVGKSSRSIITTISNAAKNSKVVDGAVKVVDFASKNVNTCITVASGVKVLLADKEDRQKVFITEGGALAGMFLAEGWMKKNLPALLEKLPVGNKWKAVIKGLTFIAGSIGFSTLGSKLGKKLADVINVPLGKEERAIYNQKQELKKLQQTQKLDIKA